VFVSESVAADLLQQVRWRDGVTCPRCRSDQDGETQDERPDEHRNVDFSAALDGIAPVRDVFDKLLGKERSQSASYYRWRKFR